jgi:hypothetical protein
MEEDLTTAEEPEEEITEWAEVEMTSRSEYIAAAYNAIAAVDDLDIGLMSNEDAKRKKRIMRKSLRIIDYVMCEMYDELFEEDEEN